MKTNGHVLAWIPDSGRIGQSNYTVLHEESDVQVKNKQILRPGGKSKKTQN